MRTSLTDDHVLHLSSCLYSLTGMTGQLTPEASAQINGVALARAFYAFRLLALNTSHTGTESLANQPRPRSATETATSPVRGRTSTSAAAATSTTAGGIRAAAAAASSASSGPFGNSKNTTSTGASTAETGAASRATGAAWFVSLAAGLAGLAYTAL